MGRIAKGRGRKSWLPEGTVAEVVRLTTQTVPPDGSTQWSTRTLADYLGIGKDTVARIWRDHQLKPWQTKAFKVSSDPDFEENFADIAPKRSAQPGRAVVRLLHPGPRRIRQCDRAQPGHSACG